MVARKVVYQLLQCGVEFTIAQSGRDLNPGSSVMERPARPLMTHAPVVMGSVITSCDVIRGVCQLAFINLSITSTGEVLASPVAHMAVQFIHTSLTT
ncbi:hypothetical protein RRG08_065117 [Elysia crispata]|uniref:Uncharacterized protein n=1 Tax=Elysia crispata TaxID=231223 RepID=A0AAE1DCE6_9GAST|nr:hypothetical protein RRG08_065117 [Elysia crispata]